MLDRETLAQRVRKAISDAEARQQDVAAAVGIGVSSLSRALSGKRDFKSLELALIAEYLGVSVEGFLSEAGVAVDGSPAARIAARVQPGSSPAVYEAIKQADLLVELDRLLSELGYASSSDIRLEISGTTTPYEQGENLAADLRKRLGMADDDLPGDLDELAEFLEKSLGIDVCFEPLPAGLDGLSISSAGFALALVSSGVTATRQRYTLAHEVGHLAAGDSQRIKIDENVLGGNSPAETRANAFAAAFLMPAEALRSAARPGFLSEERVAELLGRYRVSLDALAFRLHNVGVVNARDRDRIRSLSSSRIWLRSGRTADLRARNERRVPGGLLQRAIEAYSRGDLSIRPVASLAGIDANQLLDELSPRARDPGTGGGDAAGLVL